MTCATVYLTLRHGARGAAFLWVADSLPPAWAAEGGGPSSLVLRGSTSMKVDLDGIGLSVALPGEEREIC